MNILHKDVVLYEAEKKALIGAVNRLIEENADRNQIEKAMNEALSARVATYESEPSNQQIASACFAYRHDFGLMEEEEMNALQTEARRWWRAITKEIEQPSHHPYVMATASNGGAEAMEFAMTLGTESMAFLSLWNEREFIIIREKWPNAPKEIFVESSQMQQEVERD